MRARLGLLVGLGLTASITALVMPAGAAPTLARIGGPPTLDFPRIPPGSGNQALTNPLVIGRGSAFNGPVEIVAMDSRQGLCVWVDHPRQSELSGGCSDRNLPGRRAITVNLWSESRTRGYTQLSGSLAPEATKVRAFAGSRRVSAVVARVGRQLARRLGQRAAFGYFSVTVRGCVLPTAFRVVALDGRGRTLGSDRGFPVGGACG